MKMSLKAGCRALIGLLWVLVAQTAAAQGVAMALDRNGEVSVMAAGKSQRLNLLDYLPPGTEVRLPAGASATLVYLATSQEWLFAGPGRYRLAAAKPEVLQGSTPVATGVPSASTQAMARLDPTRRERVGLGAVVMRSTSPLRIVSPNSVDVLGPQPTLLWKTEEPLRVRVTVMRANSAAPLAQTETSEQQWTVSEPLAPGEYLWRTEPAGDSALPSRMGTFRVIGTDDARLGKLGGGEIATFSQRLTRAVLLQGMDLPHDALLLWRGLSAERPDEPALRAWLR